MISAVRQFFQAQIDLAEKAIQREQIDSTFTHEFFIKKKNVEKLVLNALAKVSGSPVEREIKRAFNKHYNRIYSTTNVKSLMDQDAFFGKSNLPVKVEKNNTTLKITLAAGAYVQKRQEIKKGVLTGKSLNQKSINGVMAELYFQMIGSIKDDTKTTFKTPGHPGLGAHGMTGEFKGQPLHAETQTTIATVSFSEGFDAKAEDLQRKLSLENNEDFSYAVDLVTTKYLNPLRKKYTVGDMQDFDTHSLNRDLIIQIEYGDAQHNASMREFDLPGIKKAGEEQLNILINEIVKTAGKDPDKILGLKGSKSFNQKAESQVMKKYIDGLFPHKTKADMRLTVNKRLLAEAKGDSKKTSKTTSFTTGTVIGSKKVSKGRGVRRKAQRGPNMDSSQLALSLKNILDAALPQRVAEKMQSPALQYRTGRFANSAEVTNVAIGPRGGTEIEYTYQRNPYETFEPGGRMGSTDRDPRRIIGESIREIAQQVMGNRFVRTRRV